jgi:hypothetical protein
MLATIRAALACRSRGRSSLDIHSSTFEIISLLLRNKFRQLSAYEEEYYYMGDTCHNGKCSHAPSIFCQLP